MSRRDDGFSLAEVAVGMGAFAVVVVVLGGAMASGLDAVLASKVTQKATALASESIERARTAGYEAVAIDAASFDASDPRLSEDASGAALYDPDGTGAMRPEPVVRDEGGAVPHRTQRTVGATAFTLDHYVTWVDAESQGGPRRDYKRVVVVVRWSDGEIERSHHASTFVTSVVRGAEPATHELAPPELDAAATGGGAALFAVSLSPLSADSYSLSVPDLRAGWIARFYRDTGSVGVRDGDVLLGEGTAPTGTVDAALDVLVEITVPTSASGVEVLTLRATRTSDGTPLTSKLQVGVA